jgi:hypothetical protein
MNSTVFRPQPKQQEKPTILSQIIIKILDALFNYNLYIVGPTQWLFPLPFNLLQLSSPVSKYCNLFPVLNVERWTKTKT